MEKLYYYIAIAVIYYGFQAYRKYAKGLEDKKKYVPARQEQQNKPAGEFNKQEIPNNQTDRRPKTLTSGKETKSPVPPSKQPSSLEELLREMDKGKSPLETNKKPHVENYEDKPVEKPLMTVDNYVDEESLAVEKMRRDLKAAEDQKIERLSLQDEHLAPYALASAKRNKYAEILRNPESLKSAFIAGEILKRKF